MKPEERLKQVPADCYESRDHDGAKLVCKDKGGSSRMIFTKATGCLASKIKIDGCFVKGSTACDYMVHDWKNRYYFVELKGRDVEKAFVQLEATIRLFFPSNTAERFWCFVVCTKSPPGILTGRQISQVRFQNRWNAMKLEVKGNLHTHHLMD